MTTHDGESDSELFLEMLFTVRNAENWCFEKQMSKWF